MPIFATMEVITDADAKALLVRGTNKQIAHLQKVLARLEDEAMFLWNSVAVISS